jgi:hypothetical protein
MNLHSGTQILIEHECACGSPFGSIVNLINSDPLTTPLKNKLKLAPPFFLNYACFFYTYLLLNYHTRQQPK